MKRPEKAGEMPETLPLTILCAMLAEERQQIHAITVKAGVKPVSRGEYPTLETIRAVKNYFKGRAEEVSTSRKVDLDRKARNDADSSDIDLAEKRGLLMLKADGKQIWADGMIEQRRAIQGLTQFSDKQRREIIEALQSVKLKEEK